MFDPKKIEEARRALLDTNVLIFAMDGGKKNPESTLARGLFEELAKRKMRLLVAAPSLAEFRMRAGAHFPRGPLIEVVAFDGEAAEYLADKLPADQLKQFHENGVPGAKHFIRYDAMIVACAGRHRASCIITTDERHMPKISSKAGVRCLTPKDFESPQRAFTLVPPAVSRPGDQPAPESGGAGPEDRS